MVIVPSGVADDLEKIQWADDDAKEFCESYEKNGYSDYRLITKAEAVAILGNSALVSQLGLPVDDNYWTIEDTGAQENNAWFYSTNNFVIDEESKSSIFYVLPVRKVNFYGLPLIESEFGGGLVYDVVAATRTVEIVAKWEDVNNSAGGNPVGWESAMGKVPIALHGEEYTALPTRAQAVKIFGNSYLVTLAGLPVDNNYWTSEEVDFYSAYYYYVETGIIEYDAKVVSYYALPVRSEVVPET